MSLLTRFRVVLDTNIFISAYMYGGLPRKVVNKWIKENRFLLIVSPFLITEVLLVFDRFNFYPQEIAELKEMLETKSLKIIPDKSAHVCRDPKDNQILDLCATGNADFLVTGDIDLLVLKKLGQTKIIKANEFLKML